MKHGGQAGLVFELFRNCAGFYRRLEEIEFNLGEEEKMREQSEVFEVKMTLQLGGGGGGVSSLTNNSSTLAAASLPEQLLISRWSLYLYLSGVMFCLPTSNNNPFNIFSQATIGGSRPQKAETLSLDAIEEKPWAESAKRGLRGNALAQTRAERSRRALGRKVSAPALAEWGPGS
ncbi:putative F-box protein [Platanthera guangdongensis]|uniref:F-box protein n=1 Tax=Platanthera guangdongensis TaxID=2320717 RepID=A0ABR2MV14_9ASPA